MTDEEREMGGTGGLRELEELVVEPRRWTILNVLGRSGAMGYTFLRHVTALSWDGLIGELGKLEGAGLIEVRHRRRLFGREYGRVWRTEEGARAVQRFRGLYAQRFEERFEEREGGRGA